MKYTVTGRYQSEWFRVTIINEKRKEITIMTITIQIIDSEYKMILGYWLELLPTLLDLYESMLITVVFELMTISN